MASSHFTPHVFRKGYCYPDPAVFAEQWKWIKMEVIQIHAAPGTYDIVVLTTHGTREDRALEATASERLTASRTSVAVGIQSFFESAE